MVHAQVAEVGLGRPPTTIRNGLRVPAALGLAQAAPSPVAACTTPSKFQGSVHAVSHSLTTLNVSVRAGRDEWRGSYRLRMAFQSGQRGLTKMFLIGLAYW